LTFLLLNQTFPPDVMATGQCLGDLALGLVARGHQVTVITSRRAYDDPKTVFPKCEVWRGVRIQRIGSTGFGKSSKWRRAADFASFLLLCSWRLLFSPKYDAIVALTSPPLISFLGACVARLRGSQFYYWVMDFNPDEAIAAGWLCPDSLAARVLDRMSRYSLRRATRIIALDTFMRDRIAAKGIEPAKIMVLPPWSHDEDVRFDPAGRERFRKAHGLGVWGEDGERRTESGERRAESGERKPEVGGQRLEGAAGNAETLKDGGREETTDHGGKSRNQLREIRNEKSEGEGGKAETLKAETLKAETLKDGGREETTDYGTTGPRDNGRQRFVVMYSGNHSPCHPLDTLLEAAKRLEDDPGIAFCFVGGGTEWRKIALSTLHSPLSTLRCLPYQPFNELSGSLSAADLHVVVMGDPFVGLVHPCKIYNILSIGAPVLYIGPRPSHVTALFDQLHGRYQYYFAAHGDVEAVLRAIEQARRQPPPSRQLPADVHALFAKETILPRLIDAVTGREKLKR
jgi:glycosyltransferase involved in cell wall biosynthesis